MEDIKKDVNLEEAAKKAVKLGEEELENVAGGATKVHQPKTAESKRILGR